MLADMGAPINPEPVFPPPSNYPRPFARFRAVAAVVRATFRFRYVCRRKRDYLQAKSDRLHPTLQLQPRGLRNSHREVAPSISLPRVTFSASVVSESGASLSQSASSAGIHLASRIPTATSSIGIKTAVQSHSRTNVAPASSKSTSPSKKQSSLTSDSKSKRVAAMKMKLSPQKPHHHASLSHSGSKVSKVSPTRKDEQKRSGDVTASARDGELASEFLSAALPQAGDYDPQLLEYMEGLERYRTRLNKTRS